jgi:outer membrane protein assembly factor BamB
MTADLKPLAPARAPGWVWRALAAARLIAAVVLTLPVLLVAWGRTLVLAMMVGRPEWWCVAVVAGCVAAAIALTAGLRRRRLPAVLILLAWVAANAILIGWFTAALAPKLAVVMLYALSALWVAWLAWLPYWPLSWPARLGVLAACAAAAPVFPLVIRVDGVTGDATRIAFNWRQPAAAPAGAAHAPAAGEAARLTPARPDDYPQFLGPQRLGIVRQAHLARDWANPPPQLRWRKPVGAGWGAFAVVGGYAVTQEQRGDAECVVCYRVANGTEVWVHADAGGLTGSMGGPGPRATPTIADGRVYAVGATGLLNCLDGATGEALWSKNILEDNHAENLEHGVCGSPLVSGRLVIVSPTGRGGPSVAAYDRDTGERVWQGGNQRASYSSPLLAKLDGVPQVLLFNADGVAGHDPDTGTVLWSFPWANSTHTNVAQPIPDPGGPDRILVASGYGKGAALFRVEHKEGKWSASAPLWKSGRMQAKFTTPVLHGGCVVGLDDGVLACLDLETGEQRWRGERYGHGQVLLAGDLLLVQAEDGAVVLVDPAPDEPRELGRMAALSGKTWNNPALAGRFLLVRTDREAACYELPLDDGR